MKQYKKLIKNLSFGGGRKRIFIGFLCAACAATCLLLFLTLILPWLMPNQAILEYLSITLGLAGIFSFAWLCLILVFHIQTGKNMPGINGIRHALIRLFLPIMEILGKPLKIDRALIRRSFIKVNNELVLANAQPVQADKVLLLLPHCIQASTCPHRLAMSLDNCKNCGGCQIGLLRQLSKEKGFRIAVATGGTVARKIVVECRPKQIIAIACERDLVSGIQDSYPIPVVGILNNRPFGPCRDTNAPLDELNRIIAFFLKTSREKSSEEEAPAQRQ